MYADSLDTDIHTFLKRHETKELLRFVTTGSVDDGKSTLIGRLLFDTRGVYEDQLKDARVQGSTTNEVDLARITDGLQAEREQGITIDVAYRYFTTPRRKFIIADTPGHIQYTRNMATGASTANVAIILIDARLGVLQQSRRHAYIASLLGIPHLVVCINKMDLVDFDEETYRRITADFAAFAKPLHFRDVTFFPISALEGDNVVHPSTRTPWYNGPTILHFLETVDISHDLNLRDFRLPVQLVLRPNLDYRGFAGQIASGTVRVGDTIAVHPSGKTSTVTSIDTFDGPLDSAFAPMSIVLRLADEIDISRGDILALAGRAPFVGRAFDAHIVWMNEAPLDPRRSYLIKHTTHYVRAEIPAVHFKVDLNTLAEVPAERLELNEIAKVRVLLHRPVPFDAYQENRGMGAFIVVDPMTNNTVGAGMIVGPAAEDASEAAAADESAVTALSVRTSERARRNGHRGGQLRIRSARALELAHAVDRWLFDHGHSAMVVDTTLGAPLEAAGMLAVIAQPSADGGDSVEIGNRPAWSAEAGLSPETFAQALAEHLRSTGVLSR